MSEWREFTAKTVDEALTNALVSLETTSDRVEYEVIEKETSRILGLFSKPAKIRVRIKSDEKDIAIDFLNKVFDAMEIEAKIEINYKNLHTTLDKVKARLSQSLFVYPYSFCFSYLFHFILRILFS